MRDLAEEKPGVLGLEENELVEAGIGGGHAGTLKCQVRSSKCQGRQEMGRTSGVRPERRSSGPPGGRSLPAHPPR
jgi:hypothetical protein